MTVISAEKVFQRDGSRDFSYVERDPLFKEVTNSNFVPYFSVCAEEQDDFNVDFSDETKIFIVKQVFSGKEIFYAFKYIVRASKLKREDVKRLLETSNLFKESFLTTYDLDSVYYLNTFSNRLKNLWASFLFLNYIKYFSWTR